LFGYRTAKIVPDILINRLIVVTTLIRPPEGVPGDIVFNNVLVFRRPTGKFAGVYCYCSEICDDRTFKTFEIFPSFLCEQSFVAITTNLLSGAEKNCELKPTRLYSFDPSGIICRKRLKLKTK